MPGRDDTLVSSPEQAREIIADLDRKILDRKRSRHQKSIDRIARATLYIALGDPKMLAAAKDAYDYSRTSETCSLYGAALRHHGKTLEACPFYEQAYKLPHEPGFEIDLAWANMLIFLNRWPEHHAIIRSLKKRIVYAGYLPDWKGERVKELSIISEGGFGDVIQHARWWPLLAKRVDKVVVYLADYFFEHGMVDLLRRQEWCPEIKRLIETPMDKPAAGMFDLTGHFETTAETVPPPIMFKADPLKSNRPETPYPRVGFCWKARSAEAPLCPDGVYRALIDKHAQKIVDAGIGKVSWVPLQLAPDDDLGLTYPKIESWEDTAAIIENLDAVLTVDTAVFHLAATMGKPVWLILSGIVDCKFDPIGNKCVWYPTVRTFKNEAFGFDHSVRSVIEAIQRGELCQPEK